MKELFKNLMSLCNEADESKFFYRDDVSPSGHQYRIFSYNYASYSDWIRPDALECRGIMFEMESGEPIRIASRPMEKFFNLNETPFTMNLDLTKAKYMLAKEDGSLVSTFLDGQILKFKSKSSIKSEQAYNATAWLTNINHEALMYRLIELARSGFTANFEYVAPDNRVVLPYFERNLVLLNVRDNNTGEYVEYDDLYKDPVLRNYLVGQYVVPEGDFVKEIRSMEDVEGFVFVMEDGLRFKLKTDWYCALHHTKDSITNNEDLFDCVVNAATDDLKGMFSGDEFALKKIDAFESVYLDFMGKALALCRSTYEELRGRDRKDYALEAQSRTGKENMPFLFGIIMQMYNGGMDYDTMSSKIATAFMKNYKQFVPKDYI